MMKTINITRHSFILIFFLTLASGCEKNVTNVDIPDYDSKLVVQCFLSPEDTMINVYVSESVLIFNSSWYNMNEFISNATVILEGQGELISLPYDPNNQFYSIPSSSIPLVAGATYTLTVEVPDGRKVTASATIPANINKKMEFTAITLKQSDINEYNIDFKFQDLSASKDFYRVAGSCTNVDYYGLEYTYPLYFDKGYELVTDLNNDGAFFYYKTNCTSWDYLKVTLMLLTVDEAYYRYHKTVWNYIGDDPFSEPVIVYSNINGGLGVFCAYRKFEIDTIINW